MSIDHALASHLYDIQSRLGLVDFEGKILGCARTSEGTQVVLNVPEHAFPAWLLQDGSAYVVVTLSKKEPTPRFTYTKPDPDAEHKLALETFADRFTKKILRLAERYALSADWSVECWFDSSLPAWIMHTPSGWEREVHNMDEARAALVEMQTLAQEDLLRQVAAVEVAK